ncbi:11003_t:CDS:2, partial [Racocetra fulgida]
ISVGICRGKYPIELLDEWDRWDAEFNSENDRPGIHNWEQAWSLLIQVGLALAQAEQ